MEKKQDNIDALCPAGKLLEVSLKASTDMLFQAAASLEKSSIKITDSIAELTKYAVRDKERIDSLEESRRCKNKKIKEVQDETQELKEVFAEHCGEHRAERKLTVASGMGGAGGLIGFWELIKYLVKTQN